MARNENRILVYAVNNDKVHSKFDIYLEFSGHREWLIIHRHNGWLYNLMRNGISLSELRRATGRDRRNLKYLLSVIDEFLDEEMSA